MNRCVIPVLAGVAGLIGALVPREASATVITSVASEASCPTGAGQGVGCTDTVAYDTVLASDTSAFISGTIAGQNAASATFTTAFENWNLANGDTWTLVDGGTLNLDLSLSISPSLGSGRTAGLGGISPVIVNISNYAASGSDPSFGQLVWTQALFTNYTPNGSTTTPTITLDTNSLSFTGSCRPLPAAPNADNNTTPSTFAASSGTAYCDPIYPFQYGTSLNGQTISGTTVSTDFFYDAPAGNWPSAAFRAIALLSTVTVNTDGAGNVTGDTLTVYQGVNYGFTLDVPEPGASLMLPGLALAFLAGRARRVRQG